MARLSRRQGGFTVRQYEAVVIGVSAGGWQALQGLLSSLRNDFPVPILIVQHEAPSADGFLAKHLDHQCELDVKLAEEKEQVRPGHIYLAPPGYHLLVERDRTLSLSVDEPVNYARPSIDVLFETASDAFGATLVGIILTGANTDGSLGLKRIKQAGGLAIVQDPATAAVDSMPKAACQQANPDFVVSLEAMGPLLNELFCADRDQAG
jgi:two-component system, chemotaxis family, protein-glutamate methylesterase/glutaminase